jgi:hypothetical protein
VTAAGYVSASKVRDGGDAGKFGDDIGVTYLQSEGRLRGAWRSVADGLSMAANGVDTLLLIAKVINESNDCSRCEPSQGRIACAEQIDVIVAGLAECKQVVAKAIGQRRSGGCKN